MMVRFHDWPERLAAFIEARRFTPFSWGGNDCCLFACDAVLEITGTDIAADYRGTYDSAFTATSVLDVGGGIAAMVSAKLPAIDAALIQRGDLATIDGGNGETLGVCLGTMVAATGADGLVFYPLPAVTGAWRV